MVDASGAIIPEARITVLNTGTGIARRAVTTEAAEFTVPNLAPGMYDITVEKEGFRTLREEGLELQVDQTARLEMKLEVGSVAETIEVTASLPVLNTETAARGEVVTSQEIVEVPLDGREFMDLALLVPGVGRKAQGGDGSQISINGARPDNSNFVIDGFSNQQSRTGVPQARPPLDAMQEFKMQVSGFSAEYGRLAGGVANMALKTGTNVPHGTVFEFLRNDAFDARNFFDQEKSSLRRNQFGGTLNGPVYLPRIYDGRNRTFFLVSTEIYRQVEGESRLGRVPSELERTGDFSRTVDAQGKLVTLLDPFTGKAFPGNRIPASLLHPAAVKAVTYYPLPNRGEQANNLLVSENNVNEYENVLGKVDHRFTDADNVSVRYMRRAPRNTSPYTGDGFGLFGSSSDQPQILGGLTYTRMFSPTLINEARFGLSRNRQYQNSPGVGEDYSFLGIKGGTTDPKLEGFPRITIRDLFTLGPHSNQPLSFAVNNYQWADTLTWVKSKHMIKTGIDIQRTQLFENASNNSRGTLNFLGRWTNDPTADFMLGLLNNSTRQVGTTNNYLFNTSYGLFVQDDFKVTPRFTLNLGLRYELMKPVVDKYDQWSSFVPELGKIVVAGDRMVPNLAQMAQEAGLAGGIVLAKDAGLPRSLVHANTRNFAPRLGFAWRPFGGTRTVVRSGYGIFYGSSTTNTMRKDLGGVFPFATSQNFNRQAKDPSRLTLGEPFPASLAKLQGVTNSSGYETHPQAQYLQSWSFTIEHEVFSSVALEAAYAGSKGTHLGRKYDYNQPFRSLALMLPDGSFPRPFPMFNAVNMYTFGSNSSYNAALFSLRKRFSRGTHFRLNYTYAKSIDETSQIGSAGDGGYSGAQDARNLRLERGRSDWDTGHSVTMTFVTELPVFSRNRLLGGWQVAGTGRLYTGQPFTPQLSNVQLDLGEANRPDRIAKGALENPTPERWFDAAAFPAVPVGAFRFGNSGRNILDGPGYAGVNLSLMKKFRVRERDYVQFRWELFNLLNHPNFELPQLSVNSVAVGTIAAADNGRVMQIGLKYVF